MPLVVLSFAVVRVKGNLEARFFVPDDYIKLFDEDPMHQIGALVFTGSQAVDFWNDRIFPQGEVIARAHAYEAEYLHTLVRDLADNWKPNDYQKKLMTHYPQGLDTPGVSLYEHKPVPRPSGVLA
jgi:hypothetical protein